MNPAFQFEEIENNIGIITFDLKDEKVNKFSTPVVQELNLLLDQIKEKPLKCLLFFSGKPGIFIAGADVKEFKNIKNVQDGYEVGHRGQLVLNKFTELPFPSVAVIEGASMGGGTELALACTYRLASDHSRTKIALPEVNLGILPGWGGTARLPRLIGLQRSLDIILTGKMLNSGSAYRNGVVDKVIPAEQLRQVAISFANDIIAGKNVLARSRRKQRGAFNSFLNNTRAGKALVFKQARKTVMQKTRGHYPAPLEALKVIKKGLGKSIKAHLELEARALGKLLVTPVSANLVKIFFWTEEVKRLNGTNKPDIQIHPVKKAAVLGAGVMGGGIAQLFASRNIPVRVKDIDYDAVAKAYQQAGYVLHGKLKRRKITKFDYAHILQNITGTTDYSGFKSVDFIVEAIVEDLNIKKKVFSELENHIRPDTVVVTNTSSLRVNDMSDAFKHPERFVGMHFFNPVHRMPLVEIIRGKNSTDKAVATAFQLAKKLGKTPVVVNDGPGFLVNRLLVPYMVEAASLLEEGHSIQKIDQAMLDFGMPMGPIELFDEVGIDVAVKVARIFQKDLGDRMAESDVLDNLVAKGRIGKKAGLGFYKYEAKKKSLDNEVNDLISVKKQTSLTKEELIKRMVYPMVNEAARCLQDKIAFRPQDVDLGMIFGTGFAPFRGGLLNYADSEGVKIIAETLDKFKNDFGNRFKPSDILLDIAKSGKGFYQYY